MTDAELAEIEARAKAAAFGITKVEVPGMDAWRYERGASPPTTAEVVCARDVPALVAEVRRLRAPMKAATLNIGGCEFLIRHGPDGIVVSEIRPRGGVVVSAGTPKQADSTKGE